MPFQVLGIEEGAEVFADPAALDRQDLDFQGAKDWTPVYRIFKTVDRGAIFA